MLAPCHTAAAYPPSTGLGGVWEELGRSRQWRCCHVDLSRLLKLEFFFPGKTWFSSKLKLSLIYTCIHTDVQKLLLFPWVKKQDRSLLIF